MNQYKIKLTVDKIFKNVLLLLTLISASIIIIIVSFIFKKGITPFFFDYAGFGTVSIADFLFKTKWITRISYGALGILLNTLYIVAISILIALPISILTSLFITWVAPKPLSKIMETIIELLSSIPSIVFGLFGMGFINPLVRDFATSFGLQTAGGVSGLSTIIVLAMMMVPTITIIIITSFKTVKKSQIEASLALGATKTQTHFKIIIGGKKSAIIAATILGVGRALGEATAVSMVCGGATGGPIFDLFDQTSTLTSIMMASMHESTGIDYDIRFSLGILLIATILITNVILNIVKRRLTRHER